MRRNTTIRSSARGRASVRVLYLAASVPPGSWLGRIPDIKTSLAATDARWGLANSLGTLGELTGFLIIAVLIGRLSTRRIAAASAAVAVVASPLLAFAPTLHALSAALFVWMVTAKSLGATMGALALVEQRRAGRMLMSHYDAIYSVGMLAGGAIAWAAIKTDISPSVQFAGTNIILLVGLVIALRNLPDEEASPSAGQSILRRLRHRLQTSLLILAGVAFLASVIDSALSQWGAIYLTALTRGDSSWGALVYPTMMVLKVIILFQMGRLLRSIGWHAALYGSVVITIVAVAVATTTSSPVLTLAGLAVVGAGTAVLGPLVNTGAAEQPRVTAGEARTVLEFGEIPAYLLMPAAIGLLATQIGIGTTLQISTISAIVGCGILGHVTLRRGQLPT